MIGVRIDIEMFLMKIDTTTGDIQWWCLFEIGLGITGKIVV